MTAEIKSRILDILIANEIENQCESYSADKECDQFISLINDCVKIKCREQREICQKMHEQTLGYVPVGKIYENAPEPKLY